MWRGVWSGSNNQRERGAHRVEVARHNDAVDGGSLQYLPDAPPDLSRFDAPPILPPASGVSVARLKVSGHHQQATLSNKHDGAVHGYPAVHTVVGV